MSSGIAKFFFWFMEHPDSVMNKSLCCALYGPDGRITPLRNGKYTVEVCGIPVEEREISGEEGKKLARELFGLDI